MKVGSVSTKASSIFPASDSWWVGLDRRAFYARLREEMQRMMGATTARDLPVTRVPPVDANDLDDELDADEE